MRRGAKTWGGWASLVIALTVAVPGCGGSSDNEPAVLTPAAIKNCFLDAGAQLRFAAPLAPKGSPLRVPVVYAVGPRLGGIGIAISPNAKIAHRLKKLFDERQEWDATIVRNGRALTLFGVRPSKLNRDLVAECAIG